MWQVIKERYSKKKPRNLLNASEPSLDSKLLLRWSLHKYTLRESMRDLAWEPFAVLELPCECTFQQVKATMSRFTILDSTKWMHLTSYPLQSIVPCSTLHWNLDVEQNQEQIQRGQRASKDIYLNAHESVLDRDRFLSNEIISLRQPVQLLKQGPHEIKRLTMPTKDSSFKSTRQALHFKQSFRSFNACHDKAYFIQMLCCISRQAKTQFHLTKLWPTWAMLSKNHCMPCLRFRLGPIQTL